MAVAVVIATAGLVVAVDIVDIIVNVSLVNAVRILYHQDGDYKKREKCANISRQSS